MKKSIFLTLSVFAVILAVTTMIFPAVGGAIGGGAIITASIVSPGAITQDAVDTAAPNHTERSVSKWITKQRPDEFPLSTFIDSIRKPEQVRASKVEYETVTYRGRSTALTSTFTQVTGSADENAAYAVTDATIFGVDDLIKVQGIAGHDGNDMVVKVVAVNSSTSINVTAINGQTVGDFQRVKTTASGTVISRLGNAKDELAAQTAVITPYPALDFNYCETQMALLKRSKLSARHRAYSGYNYNQQWDQEIYNFKSSREASGLYGVKSKIVDPVTNKPIYTADGVTNKITKSVDFGTGSGAMDVDIADVANMLEEAFAANAGSKKRMLLLGKELNTAISQLPLTRDVGPKTKEVIHGVTVEVLHSSFGEVYLVPNKTLDQQGDSQVGYVLDLGNIYKHELEPMSIEKIDPDKAGIERVQDAMRIVETSCLTTRYPDTHLKWKPAP